RCRPCGVHHVAQGAPRHGGDHLASACHARRGRQDSADARGHGRVVRNACGGARQADASGAGAVGRGQRHERMRTAPVARPESRIMAQALTHASYYAPVAAPPRGPSDSVRGAAMAGWVIIGLFFGVLGTWAATAPLNGAVVATGVVKVDGNRKSV